VVTSTCIDEMARRAEGCNSRYSDQVRIDFASPTTEYGNEENVNNSIRPCFTALVRVFEFLE
jgi:hypothetical protein